MIDIKESIRALNNCDTIISINRSVGIEPASITISKSITKSGQSYLRRYKRMFKIKKILDVLEFNS